MAVKKKKTKSNTRAAKPAAKNEKKESRDIRIDKGEVIRIAVVFLAFFIILTFIPAINNGWLGGIVAGFLKGLFGPMYFVLPFFILIIDVMWTRDHEKGVAKTKYLLYALEFVFLSIIVQVAAAGDDITFGTLYPKGKELQSAGIICGSVAMLFTSTIGNIASTVLAILGIIICALFLFGTTPKATVMAVINYFRESVSRPVEDDGEGGDAGEAADERRVFRHGERKIEADDLVGDKKPVTVELPEDPAARRRAKDKYYEDYDDGIEDLGKRRPARAESDDPAVVIDDGIPPFDLAPDIKHTRAPAAPKTAGFNTAKAEFPLPQEGERNPEANAADPVAESEDDELFLDPVEDTPYVFPPISLLTEGDSGNTRPPQSEIERTSRKLEDVLASFNVKAKVINCTCGPTVTRYELQPETGVRVKAISNLADDIALHLAATSVRIENIPGKAAVGIEIPNKANYIVRLRDLIENSAFRDSKSRLYTALGEDVAGNPVYLDIAKMPHLLIAGATGMGKSVCINSLIVSLLYRNHPNDVKLILIDPKKVEFQPYNDIPHLLVPVITEPKNAAGTLNWACNEMENRYNLIQEVGVRDLAGYNNMIADDPERKPMPQIVIIIDELADLMMTAPDDVETSICRLAQKARAAGIHLVIGTQRPSVDVVTGLIKANIPSRIAFTVASQVDSRTILDMTGAEKLLGRGDMLYYPVGAMKPMRVQGAFVDDKSELAGITQFIREAAVAHYDENIMQQIEQEAKLCGMKGKRGAAAAEAADDGGDDRSDPMLMDAIEVAIECGTVSTSLLQRRLSLGYARAARIIDKMERKGFIGQFDSTTKKRAILITHEQFLEMKLNGDKSDAGE
ncbi:MAG: DNA translocase FtsK [Clostridia bacterium]|nr:DNA translocase FtsK [Clostridia bacterium]